jgi:uncharacterized protein YerC
MNRNPMNNNFSPASLRRTGTARTVLLRMAADQERADRIRALKLARPDLTWRRIADHVGVSERAASDWQKKGGIEYANAKKLAALFEVDVDYVWRGTETSELAPTPFAGPDATADQLDRIEERLQRIELMLQGRAESMLVPGSVITDQLDRLERALTQRVDAVDDDLRRLGRAVVDGSPEAPQGPQRVPARRPAVKRKRAAKPRTP